MNRPEVLDTAKKCVCGQREQDYGSPENNFQIIADRWSAYYGQKFTALDVSMMMTLLKIARIRTGTATEDSFVDAAGDAVDLRREFEGGFSYVLEVVEYYLLQIHLSVL